MIQVSDSPPRALPIQYAAPLGTRWAKEKAAAGSTVAFDLPTDPKIIGPWILGECVGKGASGRVKVAKHHKTGQLAAVKILPITPVVSSRHSLASQQAKYEKQRLGIDREIAMMKLMNHPNIMRIYDVFEGEQELFLVLEYVQGGELFDFLVNRGRLPPQEALEFFKQIIYGLNYAHSFSIIHRDLKPENILIASLQPLLLKIADWGMAAFALPSFELETSCGSPHYASPEIVNGEKYQGTATDIWSCGVILFALLTGRLPFDDKNIRNLLSKVKAGKYEMPNWIDPVARDLLKKMLTVDPRKRITIPEILAHPWLTTDHSMGDIPARGAISAQSLPPSPSQLAQPITSPEDIDQELLASLKVIWGKHTDSQGDRLIQDLRSPPGYGVHAKAFYFLLDRYREEVMRKRLFDVQEVYEEHARSTPEGDYQILRPYHPRNFTYLEPQQPPVPLPTDQPTRSTTDHRDDANPNNTRSFGSPYSSVLPLNQGEARVLYNQSGRDFVRSPPFLSTAPLPRPLPTLGNGRGGPRPHPPRRSNAYFSPNAVGNFGGPSLGFVQNLHTLHGKHLQGQRSGAQMSSVSTVIRGRGGAQDGFVTLATPQITDHFIKPPIDKSGGYVNKRAAEIYSGPTHHHRDCFGPVTIHRSFPRASTYEGSRRNRVAKGKSKGFENVNKENPCPLDEGWSYISSYPGHDSPRLATSTTRNVGLDVGNLPRVVEVPGHGAKDGRRKERPPPLDFSQRNSFNIFGSSTNASTAARSASSGGSVRPLTSPVVEEFKGWLSNLFNWKSSGQGVFYSVHGTSRTRREISRTLESFGITCEDGGFTGSDTEQTKGLRCRLDLGAVDTTTGSVWKPVKFRIEFSPGSSDSSLAPQESVLYPNDQVFVGTSVPPRRVASLIGKSTSSNTPLPSPALANSTHLPPGYASGVTLVHEKGSITTFKAIWKRLKELHEDAPAANHCFSPTISPAPVAGNIQRLTLN